MLGSRPGVSQGQGSFSVCVKVKTVIRNSSESGRTVESVMSGKLRVAWGTDKEDVVDIKRMTQE